MQDLKYELAIAVLALVQVITAILRERWARRRDSQTHEAIVRVQQSLRPPADDTPVRRHSKS
jgi:hypothetical protein